MTFAKAGHPAFLFVVGAVACAAGLLFWPVEVIMGGFFTVREFHTLWPTACLSGSRPTEVTDAFLSSIILPTMRSFDKGAADAALILLDSCHSFMESPLLAECLDNWQKGQSPSGVTPELPFSFFSHTHQLSPPQVLPSYA